MATCPRCSWDNAEGADSCLACGSALPRALHEPVSTPAPARPSSPPVAPAAPEPSADDEREARRLAQRARREREEAHRAAMRQAVDSERQAREVAARVAALVVQSGATQIEAEETIHRVRVASDPA